MASILLASAGSALGASIGGSVLGVSAATIGGAVGQIAGSMVDSWIVSSLAPAQRIEGQRLQNLTVTTSTEGAVIPRIYGRMRLGGNIIWATDFTETVNTTSQGGKGGGPKVTTTSYLYTASFAVALCEGPISGIGRVWADGKPLDLSGATWRIYTGDETQQPDPFIAAKMGTGNAPAYRGTAYVMFEELDLTPFGNRIPQLSFEVFRPIDAPDTAEGLIKAVTMIPATGEFQYGTTPVTRGTGGNSASENVHTTNGVPDIIAALDQLQAAAPHIESVSLVVSWFGLDLRAGNSEIMPGVENATKVTTPVSWAVNGLTRTSAHQISLDGSGKLAYGGTPSDATVVEAIKEIKARGLRVTFYPFLLMDIPAENTRPNPYSDNAATIGQDKYPWRGRITCSPAAGYLGTVDKTASAATQVSAFFGAAGAADFNVSGKTVSWIGGNDWGYRRFILHYAHLCAAAGDLRHLFVWPRHQNDPVGLQALVLAELQRSLDFAALVNQHPAQAVARRTALAKPQLDQAALAGKDLDRQLAAVFPSHGAFDAFDDGRVWRAVIFKLLGAVSDLNASPPTNVFIVGGFIRVLKSAPAADVINQNDVKIDAPGFNVRDQLFERSAPAD